MVEFKKNPSTNLFEAKYITFKRHGNHDYRAYERKPIPASYMQSVQGKLQ
jgi:hypothetical protein